MKKTLILLTYLISSIVMANDLVSTHTLSDGREILTNAQGLTLYTFDVDTPGVSNCHGQCLVIWPAVIVEEVANISAPYSTTTRPNGELQLTLNGLPLYTYISDAKPGDILGDNLGSVWHIIPVED